MEEEKMREYPINRETAQNLEGEIANDIIVGTITPEEVPCARRVVEELRKGAGSMSLNEDEINWLWSYCSDYLDAWHQLT
jgi:hypothetical protein